MNIKVGMLFYVLSLFLAFFSRKIFLDCLGAEFIGLTGMLMNIMSFLSVAEFGIGISIAYFLYKPLQENNHKKINEVMSILAYLYRYIGFIIGGIVCGTAAPVKLEESVFSSVCFSLGGLVILRQAYSSSTLLSMLFSAIQ